MITLNSGGGVTCGLNIVGDESFAKKRECKLDWQFSVLQMLGAVAKADKRNEFIMPSDLPRANCFRRTSKLLNALNRIGVRIGHR